MEAVTSYLYKKWADIDFSRFKKDESMQISEENIKVTINDLIIEEPNNNGSFLIQKK